MTIILQAAAVVALFKIHPVLGLMAFIWGLAWHMEQDRASGGGRR
jgi:hypothetical protein